MTPLSLHSDEFRLIADAFGDEVANGDDAAVLDGHQLIATDTILEGVHFLFEDDAAAIGHKAVAVNLSDLAAMAGRPTVITIGLTIGRRWNATRLRELLGAIQATAHRYGAAVVGGDTTSWDGPLAICVTVLGTATRPIGRDGGRCGDTLYVSGPLGRSYETKHHLTFEPRLELAERLSLSGTFELHAMIDLSDGLSSDLHHLCAASGCGAVLIGRAVPLREAEPGGHPVTLDDALTDGEDFELLVAAGGEWAGPELTAIGTLCEGDVLIERDGRRQPLPAAGFSHSV